MVIRGLVAGFCMSKVRMLSFVQPMSLAALVVLMSFTGFMTLDEKVEERQQLKQEEVPLYAPSPLSLIHI